MMTSSPDRPDGATPTRGDVADVLAKLDSNSRDLTGLTKVIRRRTRLVIAALIFDAIFTTTLGVLYARENVAQSDFKAERHRQNLAQCESGNKARTSILSAIDGLVAVAVAPRPGETPAEIAQGEAFQTSVDTRLRNDLPIVDCSKVP